MCCTTSFTVHGGTAAIPEARRRAGEALTTVSVDLIDTDALYDLRLLISELVTNAVQAGSHHVEVEISVHRRRIHMSVSDDAPGWPEMRVAAAEDNCGRGLAIMDATAADWGVAKIDDGKTVWAVLALLDPLGTLADCHV
jgi:anti-sigma regulatory factor (Ser/Thr protein kinase)